MVHTFKTPERLSITYSEAIFVLSNKAYIDDYAAKLLSLMFGRDLAEVKRDLVRGCT